MTAQDANELAAEYLRVIDTVDDQATYVTDKTPMNVVMLGLVASLLPDIRVMHCIRDPRDTCLSCYLTDFATGNEFTRNLSDLACVYRDYQRQMAHWKRVLPLPILDVHYEDLIADQEGQTRRMLGFLNLPWDERCLRFHENRRLVGTASLDQVRKPIYATSVGRWKQYEKHLGELMGL
jgi:hypothetical protein